MSKRSRARKVLHGVAGMQQKEVNRQGKSKNAKKDESKKEDL